MRANFKSATNAISSHREREFCTKRYYNYVPSMPTLELSPVEIAIISDAHLQALMIAEHALSEKTPS